MTVAISIPADSSDNEGDGVAQEAIEACLRGWRVIPLHGLTGDTSSSLAACDCGNNDCTSPGKHPLFASWQTRATGNSAVAEAWWSKHPSANLGIPTGPEFGVVIDIDPVHGGDEEFDRFQSDHGVLPVTLMSRTGSGGRHLVYAYPKGYRVGNSLPLLRDYRGIDVRGEGGFIVAPPSLHVSGQRYEWINHGHPVVPLPEVLLEGLRYDALDVDTTTGGDPWAASALENECRRVRMVRRGQRNETLFSAACAIGEIVAGGGLPEHLARWHLEEAACAAGLDEDEAQGTILRAFERTKDQPRRSTAIRSRDDATDLLESMHDALYEIVWPGGHQGTRMRVVMEGMIRIAKCRGGPGFYSSVIGIAKETAMSIGTVRRALGECIEHGYLIRVKRGVVGSPSQWKLTVPNHWEEERRSDGEVTP